MGGCSSVVECMLSMHGALGTKKKKEKGRRERKERRKKRRKKERSKKNLKAGN